MTTLRDRILDDHRFSKEAVQAWEKVRTDSKSSFYDRMAVLAGGSIAVIASLAKFFQDRLSSSHLPIDISLLPLYLSWFSLVFALAHNYMWNRVRDLSSWLLRDIHDSYSAMAEKLDKTPDELLSVTAFGAGASEKQFFQQKDRRDRCERLAQKLGFASLITLAAAYLALIVILRISLAR